MGVPHERTEGREIAVEEDADRGGTGCSSEVPGSGVVSDGDGAPCRETEQSSE